MPSIRPVSASDTPALDHIFRTTSGPAFKSEPAATISSHLYCHSYATLSPNTCFVLDDGNAKAVGYVLSTPDTAAFAAQWRDEYGPALERQIPEIVKRPVDYEATGLSPPTFESDLSAHLLHQIFNCPDRMLSAHVPRLWSEFPAHFHVDILPEYQRKGWGRKMIDVVLGALRAEGAKGVNLGMEAGNEGAGRFYEALGFERLPEVLDGGDSGRVGEANGVVFYVKRLE